jgi:hypothetical protein
MKEMKSRLFKFFTALLAINVLISSIGMITYTRTCMAMGTKIVMASPDKDPCCEDSILDISEIDPFNNENEKDKKKVEDKSANNNEEAEKCCETEKELLKVEQESENSSVSVLSFNVIFYLIYKFKAIDVFGSDKKEGSSSPKSQTSLYFGRTLLAIIQSYLI